MSAAALCACTTVAVLATAAAVVTVRLIAGTKGCRSGNGTCAADCDTVVGISADRLQIAADRAVVDEHVDAIAETGEDIVSNCGGLFDRDRIVAVTAVIAERSADRAGDCCGVRAAAEFN